jgi:hypothetical protein
MQDIMLPKPLLWRKNSRSNPVLAARLLGKKRPAAKNRIENKVEKSGKSSEAKK